MTTPTGEERCRLQGRLDALRDTLTSAWGATVADVDLDALPDDVIAGLCDHEAQRVRALIEGTAAGWTPGWYTRATPAAPPTAPTRGHHTPADVGGPIRVRFHRSPRGRVVA